MNHLGTYIEKADGINVHFFAFCDKWGDAAKIPTYKKVLPIRKHLL